MAAFLAGGRVLLREDVTGVATLILNRPDKKNALNQALFESLHYEIGKIAAATETIGCVILIGAGGSFSAGADLEMVKTSTPEGMSFRAATLEALGDLPQPVIAAVRGHCYAGALELALTADFIVASESARFVDTHTKLGGTPRWGLTVRLPRRIGEAAAKDIMMTGRLVDGREALHLGLANRCVPDAQLEVEARAFADDLLSKDWAALRGVKHLVTHQTGCDFKEALAHERNFKRDAV